MNRILVTGAGGFIGRNVLPFVEGKGEVYPVSSKDCNLLDAAAVTKLLERLQPTHVLHLAWIATPGIYQTSPENQQWLEASKHLFREAARCGAERIVGAGTCFEYDWTDGLCVEKRTPLEPSTLYGECKRDCGLAFAALGEELNVSSAWGRVFFLYGPGEPPIKFVASVINALLKGEEAKCTHGRQIRDFMMVKDTAAAFVALLFSHVQGPVNIGTGEDLTLAEIAKTIGTLLNQRERILLGARPAPEGEAIEIRADIHRLRDEVRFVPEYTLRSGLQETIEWWQNTLAAGR